MTAEAETSRHGPLRTYRSGRFGKPSRSETRILRRIRRRRAETSNQYDPRTPPSSESRAIPPRRAVLVFRLVGVSLFGSLLARPLAALALVWLITTPVPAAADSCAYAHTGPDGSHTSVAVTGPGACPTKPAPKPTKPKPTPTWVTPRPTPRPPNRPVPPPPQPHVRPTTPAPPVTVPSPRPGPPSPAPARPTRPPERPEPPERTTAPAAPPPAHAPSASARPPAAGPVALPHYRRTSRPRPESGTSVVTTTLVIIAPAVLATAILRPRGR